MISVRRSPTTRPNQALAEAPRKKGEDNLAWLGRQLTDDAGERLTLLLLGGRDPSAFRLRVAQSHVRDELTPSSWSHVLMLGKPAKNLGTTPTTEISLTPPRGFGFPAGRNGVQTGRLSTYASGVDFPNIAVLTVGVAPAAADEALAKFEKQRGTLDALELTLAWLGFLWGVGRAGNPLLDGMGIPSATMIEYVIGAAGLDLTPGLANRSSCPEAIWQGARWWHDYYEKTDKDVPTGAFTAEHAF